MPKKNGDPPEVLRCSFCNKDQSDVRKLIAGPTVFICDECVELCMDIIREDHKSAISKSRDGVPTPSEIQGVLDDFARNMIGHQPTATFLFPPGAGSFPLGLQFFFNQRFQFADLKQQQLIRVDPFASLATQGLEHSLLALNESRDHVVQVTGELAELGDSRLGCQGDNVFLASRS